MWKFFFGQSEPPPSLPPEFDRPWRTVNWNEPKIDLLTKLNNSKPGNPAVDTLKILLYGPVGAGKSSFINSVNSCLRDRITARVLSDAASETLSFTLECKTYKFKKDTPESYYPFTLTDIMGIEASGGIQTRDIVKILHGHIKADYIFNPAHPISEEDPKYNKNPRMKDRIHCLVGVLDANTISDISQKFIDQMREVRKQARLLGIPQVVIMTKVDEACPLVKENLQKIYTSKKIKNKIEECSGTLGVPINCIYPIKNYHVESSTNSAIDTLILNVLHNVFSFANDYVEDQADNISSAKCNLL